MFDCGNEELNDWLVRYASQAMAARDAVVYLLHEDREILGYFTLSAGSCSRHEASLRVGKRAPDPVPMILLGRMGVDLGHQGQGLGFEIIRQALKRALSSAGAIGARGILLHAIDDSAQQFYAHLGFEESLVARQMMISFAELAETLGSIE